MSVREWTQGNTQDVAVVDCAAVEVVMDLYCRWLWMWMEGLEVRCRMKKKRVRRGGGRIRRGTLN